MKYNVPTDKLSAQAQRLVELCSEQKQSPEEVLKNHPELMSGLNEYINWVKEEGRAVGKSNSRSPVGHSLRSILKSFLPQSSKNKKEG